MRKVAIAPIAGALLAALTSTIAASGVDGSYTCSSTSACFSAAQSAPSGSSGAGFHGSAVNSAGVRGTSTNGAGTLGQSASGSIMYPGVEGESTNNNGSDVAGGFGLTGISGTAPAYGVYALGGAAVYGQTTYTGNDHTGNFGNGIVGSDELTSVPDYNAGVYGSSVKGIAIKAVTGNNANGDATTSGNGVALEATNYNTGGIGAILGNPSGSLTVANGTTNLLKDAGGKFVVDYSGSEKIAYGARTTAPSIEDVGGGQLVQGSAYVRLDSDLADVIDRRIEYRVFITPDGDSNQLYVTQKSPAGFLVREAHGGRSTIAFDYRIVAKPFDENGRRLATAPFEKPSTRAASDSGIYHMHLAASRSLDPFEQLRERLGPAKFAAALAEFKREQRR